MLHYCGYVKNISLIIHRSRCLVILQRCTAHIRIGLELSLYYAKHIDPQLEHLLSTAVYGHRFNSQFAFQIGNTANYDKIRNSNIEQFEASIGVRRGRFIKNFSRVSRLVEDKLQDVMEQLKELAPSATIGQRIYREIEKRLRHFRGHGGLQI